MSQESPPLWEATPIQNLIRHRPSGTWLAAYQQRYAPTVINNSIAVLRAVFQEAVAVGARFNNPAADLWRVKIRPKRLELPSRGQSLKFVDAIRTAGARQSKDCANLVRFLAYGGMRIGEAKHVSWADVNFDHRKFTSAVIQKPRPKTARPDSSR